MQHRIWHCGKIVVFKSKKIQPSSWSWMRKTKLLTFNFSQLKWTTYDKKIRMNRMTTRVVGCCTIVRNFIKCDFLDGGDWQQLLNVIPTEQDIYHQTLYLWFLFTTPKFGVQILISCVSNITDSLPYLIFPTKSGSILDGFIREIGRWQKSFDVRQKILISTFQN